MNEIKLAPWPRKLVKTRTAFEWRPGDRIALDPRSGDGDLDACSVLADEMKRSGVPRPVLDRREPSRKQLRGLRLGYAKSKKFDMEGYSIRVARGGVDVKASSPIGMFHAVQTLRQIHRCAGSRWPGMIIEDEPQIHYRGLMISASQGIMPRPDVLERWVERMAAFKLNVLQVYLDRGFHFTSHPKLSEDMVRYTAEDFLKLDAICARHHVDLQPNWNSFGHQGGFGGIPGLLNHPKYAGLAEKTDSPMLSLCPTDPKTYRFLSDLYADFLPLFRSKFVNVGCDEVGDLGMGRSAPRAKRLGNAALFAEHVIKLRELAARHGKRIQIWADHIGHYPEILDLLPKDVIPINWVYENDNPRIEAILEHCVSKGFETWGSPGVSTWGSVMNRHFNAATNIRAHAKALVKHGGTGMLNTDWAGAGGWPGLWGTGFHAHVLGAAEAWSPGALDETAFDEAFALHGLGDPSGKTMAAIRSIGGYLSAAPPSETPSPNLLSGAFPRPRRLNVSLKTNYFDQMVSDINAAREPLALIVDPEIRGIYRNAARHALLGARDARLNAAYAGEGSELAENEIQKEAVNLRRDLRGVLADVKRAWLSTNTPDHLDEHVHRLTKIIGGLTKANVSNALKRRNESGTATPPASVVIPQKGTGPATALAQFHAGSPRWGQPPTLDVRVELSYDRMALHLKMVGEDPMLTKGVRQPSLRSVMALNATFDVFICPIPENPLRFGQLIIDGAGRVILRSGAPFTGLKTRSRTRNGRWIVNVEIPWAGFGRSPRPGDRWRGNVTYSAPRFHQYASWSPVNGFFDFDQFGEWLFE